MAKRLFVNLPIKEVKRTRHFFESLGFEFNPQFSDNKALCLILGENFFGMLLEDEYFKTFIKKPISNAKEDTEVLLLLQLDTKEEVHRMVDKAIELGAHEYNPPSDNGFMFQRVFEDLDGHQWEIAWMDESYNFDDLPTNLD